MFSPGFNSSQCLTSFSSIDHFLCLDAWFFILLHLTQMRFSPSTHLQMCLTLETLTSIIRTGLPILVELLDLVISAIISNDLTWMANLSTQIPDCDSHSPALLDFFLSWSYSICSTITFPQSGNSDHVVVSVFIDFPSYSQWDASFHRIADYYFHANWDGLHDHLSDVPWEDIFNLSTFAAAKEFCECVDIVIHVYILLKTFLRTLILMTQVSLYLLSLLELSWNCIILM